MSLQLIVKQHYYNTLSIYLVYITANYMINIAKSYCLYNGIYNINILLQVFESCCILILLLICHYTIVTQHCYNTLSIYLLQVFESCCILLILLLICHYTIVK